MNRFAAFVAAVILAASWSAAPVRAADYSPVTGFDPSRNPETDLQEAAKEAKRTGKHILLDVGGEWCRWCHILDRFIAGNSSLQRLLLDNFVVVKINYSDENENKKFLSKFPSIEGYPHLFVLDSSGRLLRSQSTGPLEQGQSYNLNKFSEFLKRWAPAESGFVQLLNGRNLDGWTLTEASGTGYDVENGSIVCLEGGGGKLFADRQYSNFILRFEFKLQPGGNNGVGLRAPLEGDAAYVGMEIQILDNEDPKYRDLRPAQYHGSVYDVFPAKRGYLKKPGEWNYEEISAENRRISVILNGALILDVDLDSMKDPEVLKNHPGLARTSGYLGFLGHRDRVEFRNIRIKELP